MRRLGRGVAKLLCVLAPACGFDSEGQGGSSSATIATTAPATEEGSSAESNPSQTTASGPDTGDDCPPGNIGCPCDNGSCHDVLSCIADVCASPNCPNSVVEAFEECDDSNTVDDDGCDADCTYSKGVSSIALGLDYTCVVFWGGAVRCWGNGERGKTGHGDVLPIGAAEPASAAPTLDVGGPAVKVSLGTDSSCALLRDGKLTCWGSVTDGRLGYGMDVMEDIGDSEPASFGGRVDIGGNAVDVAVGPEHVCAVRVDGRVLCWGNGGSGRLGYGGVAPVGALEKPVDIGPVDLGGMAATHVAVGAAHSCALLENQEVHCWGDSDHGILGDPSLVLDLGDDPGETPALGVKVDLGGAAIAIDAGNQHTCALLANSSVRCWGFGNGGRLGLGNSQDVGVVETPANLPVDLGGPAMQIATGRAHTCALRQDGELLCWGTGNSGKLGSDDNQDLGDVPEEVPSLLVPVSVFDEQNVRVLWVGGGGDHTCARLSHGRVRCWGEAQVGQLGYGDTEDVGSGTLTIVDRGDVDIGPP